MNEFDFFCYSLFVQDEREYNRNWSFVIFRAYFGTWISKSLRSKAVPKKPTDEYLNWLHAYFERSLGDLKSSNSK